MNRIEYLLTQGSSECNEVAHRLSKALHFGLKEIQPGQAEDNAKRVVGEYMDLIAVMEMLEEEGLLVMPSAEEQAAVKARKKAKVESFMAYARKECGTLRD